MELTGKSETLPQKVPFPQRIPETNITFQLVPIPGGKFLQGSPGSKVGRQDTEGLQVSVMIRPHWISKYEVTWEEFRVYMNLKAATVEYFRRKRRITNRPPFVDAVTAPSVVYDMDCVDWLIPTCLKCFIPQALTIVGC